MFIVKYGHFRANLAESNSRYFECVNRYENVTNFGVHSTCSSVKDLRSERLRGHEDCF